MEPPHACICDIHMVYYFKKINVDGKSGVPHSFVCVTVDLPETSNKGDAEMAAKKQNTAQAVQDLAQPVAEQLGLQLWDVVFVKEGPHWFLRLYIDKPGGVFIEDCEKMSRAVDPLIDKLDPTEHEYYLEVSSPGLARQLRTDKHLDAYIGQDVKVRLYRPDENKKKELFGILAAYNADTVSLMTEGEQREIARKEINDIRADDDRDLFGGNNR